MTDPNKYKAMVLDISKKHLESRVFDTWQEAAKFLRENTHPLKRWTTIKIINCQQSL
jgi:hypothetical protein